MQEHRPDNIDEAGEILRSLGESRSPIRFRGGGTRYEWGMVAPEPDAILDATGIAGIVEHNSMDLTAVLKAGTRFTDAQTTFAQAGQMIALDPPLEERATLGGLIATGDSGPLRHRYGAARDLLLGMTVVLSDGTVARSGGKVIKNVAGYDLGKLFAGSFGTLGLIAQVAVRLHPLPPETATARGLSQDPGVLQRAASAVSHASLEASAVDVGWDEREGCVLARFAGASPTTQAGRAAVLMAEAGTDGDVVEEDEPLWERQRARQRSPDGVVVRISGLQTEIARVLHAAKRLGASVTGRAAFGLLWVAFDAPEAAEAVGLIEELRKELAPLACVVLDAPVEVRSKLDVWGAGHDGAIELMRRVKSRFDPYGVCNSGIFVGGI